MLFGVVCDVNRERWVYYMEMEFAQEKEASLEMNVGRPIVTNGDFLA